MLNSMLEQDFNKQLEKELEQKCSKILKDKGALSFKFVSPGNAGVPDRLILTKAGKAFFIEYKQKGKDLRPLQRWQVARIEKQGFNVYVVDSLDKFEEVLAIECI